MIRKRLKGLLILYAALICAFLFSQVYLPTLAEPKNILNSTFLLVLFTSSWFFVHIGAQNNSKRFVVNFMIMTVIQFLAFFNF
jgi:hypothetical protein